MEEYHRLQACKEDVAAALNKARISLAAMALVLEEVRSEVLLGMYGQEAAAWQEKTGETPETE